MLVSLFWKKAFECIFAKRRFYWSYLVYNNKIENTVNHEFPDELLWWLKVYKSDGYLTYVVLPKPDVATIHNIQLL